MPAHNMNWKNLNTERWTLFLDRDGTLNRNIEGDYVRNPQQYEWLPGALESLKIFSKHFWKIIVLTNQQGIGKGLMTIEDLERIHSKMLADVKSSGGRIDAIYYCPHLASDNCGCRKPKTGLALQARIDFPDIDFKRSIMVGDKSSDISLGKAIGAVTVALQSGGRMESGVEQIADIIEKDFKAFSERQF